MQWVNVKLVFQRELRDQLRDRRTIFTIAVLPLLLYPLLGMSVLQVAQFMKEHPTRIWVIGSEHLDSIAELSESAEPLIVETTDFTQPDAGNEFIFGENYCPPDEAKLISLDLTHSADRKVLNAIRQLAGEDLDQIEDPDALRSVVDQELEKAELDALLFIQPGESAGDTQPRLVVIVNSASDKSRIASERVDRVAERYRQSLVRQTLEAKQVTSRDTEPFQLVSRDIAAEESRRAAIWSKILPFVMLIWALTGAFYPAIDLCAGEKERGTLETLLSSPAKRAEIVWGKLLTIMAFSMSTALLNLTSMGVTGTFLINQFGAMGLESSGMQIGAPPIASMGWLLLAMIPVSALFSAMSLAIAAFARSSKEGQYYLMPLLMITLPLMMLPMLPAAELDLGTSLIPVTGMMLLLRSLIEGQYSEAARFALPVMFVTATCCLLAIRWAIDQFNNESVLFRESERLGLGVWVRHMVRDRGLTPTIGEAVLCGVLILMIKFFAGFVVAPPETWNGFVTVTVIVLMAFVATPALMMAIMLTRSPGRTLMLHLPKGETRTHTSLWWFTLPGAAMLAFCLHPAIGFLASAVMEVYPVGDELRAFEQSLAVIIDDAPGLWAILAVFALTPAICEELAFRGFIFTGLASSGKKWTAILVSSLFFGVTHGVLQQSIVACFTGMILGYVAYQTRSIFPCMIYHFTHNSASILIGTITAKHLEANPFLSWMFDLQSRGEDVLVATYSPVAGTLMVLLGIVFLGLLSRLKMRDPARQASVPDAQTAATPVAKAVTPMKLTASTHES